MNEAIKAAAYTALRNAGFRHDDEDLLALFDLTSIGVKDGVPNVPASFVQECRQKMPHLFFPDAMAMSSTEFKAGIRAIEDANRKAANDRAHDRFIKELAIRFPARCNA
jgi:hypothetical protein